MVGSTTVFEVGRMNFFYTGEVDAEPILRGLAGGQTITSHGTLWQIVEVERVDIGHEIYFSGYLVKFKSNEDEEVVDTANSRLATESVANFARAKARFMLEVGSHAIAFHPVGREISSEIFQERFKSLFEENHSHFMIQIDIQMMQDEKLVLETIDRFSTISRIDFCLRPSNPSATPSFEELDRRIRELELEKLEETYKVKEGKDGLQLAHDPEIRERVAMAAAGYGEGVIRGEIEGEERTIRTSAVPLAVNIPLNADAPAGELAHVVHEIFRTVLKDQKK